MIELILIMPKIIGFTVFNLISVRNRFGRGDRGGDRFGNRGSGGYGSRGGSRFGDSGGSRFGGGGGSRFGGSGW